MKRAWLDKFHEQVMENLDTAKAKEILTFVVDRESLSRLRKAQCIAGAVAQLEHSADKAVVADILHGCACEFSKMKITAIKQIYSESFDLADFWIRLRGSNLMGEFFEVRKGWFVIVKNPYRPDLQARYPEDPFTWYCHCGSIVKPLHGRMSSAICHCGAGFYRPLFASLFGVPVQIEVRESLVKGDARCVIAIRVPSVHQNAVNGNNIEHQHD
jgi:hypothetical protein